MAEELISINVWLAGRSYRIRIKATEEESVRKAVKVADDKIREMRTHYAGKDDQDFVAMSLLMYAANAVTEGGSMSNPVAEKDISDMLKKINDAIGE
ncbi:MAG: cell division protein ZapA [Sphingobacteriales bacterium]|nr:MAG: cell division protein ZapA [Sphingobacteriales bacterium]